LQMKTMQAEKDLMAQKVDLELREMQLKADSEKCAMKQQMGEQKLAMQSQVHAVKTSATDQVRTLKDQSLKKESQSAHMADTKLSSSVDAIQAVTDQMAKMNESLLTAIQSQAEQTASVLQSLTAPRRRRAIRGKDGKIESMEEELA